MKPIVINIRQAPAGWTRNSKFVYIGRPRRIEGMWFDGLFGNPVVRGSTCPQCGEVHQTAGSTLKCYEEYLRERLEEIDSHHIYHAIKGLWGKTLVCFCKPNPCHGDILADLCEELSRE